ncbi:hypothetical protein ADL26_09950 [Thermoactinomyces vulgaris]|jgi:hypothetical protein|nr:hypothetical protein ADL26_09950 [Thermoactinomyces vulgaris]
MPRKKETTPKKPHPHEQELSQMLSETWVNLARTSVDQIGRTPTLEEWQGIMQVSLAIAGERASDELAGKQVTDCKIKVKKAPKSAKSDQIQPGDIVAIPLLDGKLTGYGMIVRGGKPDEPWYLEYYDLFSKRAMTLATFKKKEKKQIFTLCTEAAPILTGAWKRIGKMPFDEAAYQLPDFYGYDITFFGNSRLYYISRGAANSPDAREYGVSKEEAEAVRNPDGIHSRQQVESWLYEVFVSANQ